MVYIRADSNSTIAGGHIMRCIAIAKALIDAGEAVEFLIADENPAEVLDGAGIPYINLRSNWQNLMSDIDQVKQILDREKESILLIDTYQVTKEYVERVKPFAKVVYLGSKPEYLGELDTLINYSTDIDYDFYKTNYGKSTKLLLGPSYAPLRKEFQNVEPYYRNRIAHVLLTTGNTDQDGIITKVLEKIEPIIEQHQIVIDVVIGRMFENKEQIHRRYDENKNVSLYDNVSSMSSLMKKCDLAISANGTTVYELSAIGLPTISFAIVEEQIRSAETLDKLGIVDYCGKIYEDSGSCIEKIIDRIKYYINNDESRIILAQKAHALMDGNGCQRIIDAILR